jgi:hypothetical protein
MECRLCSIKSFSDMLCLKTSVTICTPSNMLTTDKRLTYCYEQQAYGFLLCPLTQIETVLQYKIISTFEQHWSPFYPQVTLRRNMSVILNNGFLYYRDEDICHKNISDQPVLHSTRRLCGRQRWPQPPVRRSSAAANEVFRRSIAVAAAK